MKNIYDITKGQLLSIWIFGVIGWLWASGQNNYGSELGGLLMWLIPFALVFYTIGYKNYKKNNSQK